MRVLHINSYFSTSGLFKELFDRQEAAGIALDVYVPISHSYPEQRLPQMGSYSSVSRTFDQWNRWIFPLKHKKIYQDLVNTYPLGQYDLIHAHSLFSNGWLAYQVYKNYGIPYIVAVRNADLRTFFQKMPWMRKMGLEILRAAQEVVFISQNTYNEVFEKYVTGTEATQIKRKSIVLANGVNQYWHDHAYKDKDRSYHAPLRIVSTGKIMANKGFLSLARMSDNYSQLGLPIEVHIIGPAWNKRIVEKFKEFPHVTYHGPMTKEEMVPFYRNMDVYVMMSSPETFGLVYVEAMSQGLPVIYTKGEGFDSFFEQGEVGCAVRQYDQLAFNDALDYILSDYQAISQRAVDHIKPFDWDIITKKYTQLYQAVLYGTQRPSQD